MSKQHKIYPTRRVVNRRVTERVIEEKVVEYFSDETDHQIGGEIDAADGYSVRNGGKIRHAKRLWRACGKWVRKMAGWFSLSILLAAWRGLVDKLLDWWGF